MKKLFVYSLAICTALFVSCSKDSSSSDNNGGGNQITGKRISEIYYSNVEQSYFSNDNGQTWSYVGSTSTDNNLVRVWHWEHDKLTSVDYYYQDHLDGTDKLNYNNEGLVSEIVYYVDGEESESVEFSYNGTAISKIKYFDHGTLESSYDVSYENDKPIRITCTYMSENKTMSKHGKSFMENMFKTDEISSKDGILPYTELAWIDNNMTKMYVFDSDLEYFVTYTYDNKNNPYYGRNSSTALMLAWGSSYQLSQNNALSETYNVYGDLYTVDYTYNYSDNYPTDYKYPYENIYEYSVYLFKYTGETTLMGHPDETIPVTVQLVRTELNDYIRIECADLQRSFQTPWLYLEDEITRFADSGIFSCAVQKNENKLIFTADCQIPDELPEQLIIRWFDSGKERGRTVVVKADQ